MLLDAGEGDDLLRPDFNAACRVLVPKSVQPVAAAVRRVYACENNGIFAALGQQLLRGELAGYIVVALHLTDLRGFLRRVIAIHPDMGDLAV